MLSPETLFLICFMKFISAYKQNEQKSYLDINILKFFKHGKKNFASDSVSLL